jgi:RNA polymerase sigma factor (sigma-70 family)
MNELQLLWEQFLEGDNSALGELYEHLFEPLVFLSYYFVKNNECARDIVSEIFVQLMYASLEDRKRKWHSIEDIHSYLNKMIRNKSIDYLRQTQNRSRILSKINITDEQLNDIFPNEALNVLSEQDRELVGLHLQGFDNHELASQFNLSEKTVRNKLSLSRKKLIHYFKLVLIIFS